MIGRKLFAVILCVCLTFGSTGGFVYADGKTIAAGNYTVSYDPGRKNAGTYKVKIKLKGNYSGTYSTEFRICYKDVPVKHNYQEAVYWASDKGIAAGYTGSRSGIFGVGDNITRGQVVMFLWRAAGKPAPEKNTETFKDVPVTHSFYKAVQWASEQGITGGYGNGTFGPEKMCTRGQCVTFLYRMLK